MEWARGQVIGRGSFGTVNLATVTKSSTNTNTNTNNRTSIVVKSSGVSNSCSLINEKRVLIELGNCFPNIIHYFGDSFSEENGTQLFNLFLEFASKGSLADQVRKSEGNKLVISEVKRYTRGILKGLCHVHQSGFVHSDVKLQNILVFGDGEAKLADFGLARRVEDCNSGFQLRGTPMYMSPEVIAGGIGKEVMQAADIWAAGCAVVEMVTGNPAWELSDVGSLFYRVGFRGECPGIPRSLCDDGKDFLRKCFMKDPNERWTARMLLEHPFLSGCEDADLHCKPSVSPRCPFEFPDWSATECSSFGSGLTKSIDSVSFCGELDTSSCWSSISSRFEGESISDQVPDWNDSNEWVIIR